MTLEDINSTMEIINEITIFIVLNPYFELFFKGLDDIEKLVKINEYSKILILLVSKMLYVGKVHLSFDIDILSIANY